MKFPSIEILQKLFLAGNYFNFLKRAFPGLFLIYLNFDSLTFKELRIFLRFNVKNDPSNSQPVDRQSHPLTTRPALPSSYIC